METILTAEMQQQKRVSHIIRDYGKRLYAFIRGRVGSREDAEDILQDVWYQLSRAGNLHEIENISGWLYRVARNRVTDLYRKRRLPGLDEISFINAEGESIFREVVLSGEDTPDTTMLREMFWEVFAAALTELPEKQREVFVRNELQGETLQQIADALGENIKTIISRKGYAVKHIRKRLGLLYKEFFN